MERYQINRFHVQKSFALFGMLGPIINVIVFTVLGFIYPGYNPISQHVSELATSIAPHNLVMNTLGFNLFGFYVIVFGIGLYIGIKKQTLTKVSLFLFIITGIFIFALAWFPCDPGCSNQTITGIGHTILTTISGIMMPLAIILLIHPLRNDHNWRGYWWFFFVLLGIFLTIFSPLIILYSFSLISGLVQRLGLSVPLSWIFIMSTKLYRLAG
jgi:hypothetical protein